MPATNGADLAAPRVVVLAGGVGGARFVAGLLDTLRHGYGCGDSDLRAAVTVVSNTGDDMWLAGLRVCPDLDTMTYTLAGVISTTQGWGRENESTTVSVELAEFGVGWPWFTLGDRDLGTHIARSAWLREGRSLTEATAKIAARWNLPVTLLPMSDTLVETRVELEGGRDIHFEEWWVRHRAGLPAVGFRLAGGDEAHPSPAVLAAVAGADVIIVAPSNPIVSIGPILSVPGMLAALLDSAAPIVGISPIIGGAPVRGMADACLSAVGVSTSATAVGRHYGDRASGGLLDAWLVDQIDAPASDEALEPGPRTVSVPLWMSDPTSAAQLAQDALAAGRHRVATRASDSAR